MDDKLCTLILISATTTLLVFMFLRKAETIANKIMFEDSQVLPLAKMKEGSHILSPPHKIIPKLSKYLQEPMKDEAHSVNDPQSQAQQDVTIYAILGNQSGGTFVEIGANDGRYFSNTIWLESQHQWTGLLIEADPNYCRSIRRNAWRLCACISNRVEQIEFVQYYAHGGDIQHMSEEHKLLIPEQHTRVNVTCFEMAQVLHYIGIPHINYFSLDVEGSELIMLDSMKYDLISGSITVDVWSIEYRSWNGREKVIETTLNKLAQIRAFFREIGGYEEYKFLSNDDDHSAAGALDVIFVSQKILLDWCKTHSQLPDGSACRI